MAKKKDWRRPCLGCMTENLSYLAAHADAERRVKAGEVQKLCPVCGLWRFPSQLRTENDGAEKA